MTIKIPVLLALGLLLFAIQSPVNGQCEKDCTQQETCFKKLFNGESTEGWRGFQKDHVPARWVVEDGTLHFNPKASGDGGDIIFDKTFANFHLKLEWKIAEKGNSGIFYLGSEDSSYKEVYQTAPEMQVLDNERHPDAKLGKDGNGF